MERDETMAYLMQIASTHTAQPIAQLVPMQILWLPWIIMYATAAQKTISMALRIQ